MSPQVTTVSNNTTNYCVYGMMQDNIQLAFYKHCSTPTSEVTSHVLKYDTIQVQRCHQYSVFHRLDLGDNRAQKWWL